MSPYFHFNKTITRPQIGGVIAVRYGGGSGPRRVSAFRLQAAFQYYNLIFWLNALFIVLGLREILFLRLLRHLFYLFLIAPPGEKSERCGVEFYYLKMTCAVVNIN